MNKELYKREIGQKLKDIIIGDGAESVSFKFDFDLDLSSYHDQDCCESVYADFSILKYHSDSLKDKTVNKLIIKSVDKMGFLLCFKMEKEKEIKIFIPCYNFQNGYYSSDLKLIISDGGQKVEINISDLVEDHID